MINTQAYWLSPRGDVIPVDTLHINSVTSNLEKFGLDKKYVDELYKKHDEGPGTEGKAREEVIAEVMKKGWVRLRYAARSDIWTAQLTGYTKRQKEYIWDWVNSMLNGKWGDKSGKFSELVVMDEKGKVLRKGSFDSFQKTFGEGVRDGYSVRFCLMEDYQPETLLVETNLSRVWQHVNSNKPLAIMTAFRGNNEFTPEQNKTRNIELAKLVREQGFGYFFLDGHWIENMGAKDETPVVERSLFIIGGEGDDDKMLKFITKMIKKYNQDAAIIKMAEDKTVTLLFKDGSTQKIGKWTPQKVAQGYSKLRNGKTFVFETAWTHGGMISHLASKYSEKSKDILEKLDNHLGKSYT